MHLLKISIQFITRQNMTLSISCYKSIQWKEVQKSSINKAKKWRSKKGIWKTFLVKIGKVLFSCLYTNIVFRVDNSITTRQNISKIS